MNTQEAPARDHGPVADGKVECPIAGDWWDVITADGKFWCDGCQQILIAPEPPASVEVLVEWHEHRSYQARTELDIEDFVRMLRGESPYVGAPADPEGIFTDLVGSGTVAAFGARIREAMADEDRRGAVCSLLGSYFADNMPDSSDSYVKCVDGLTEVDAVRSVD